MSFKGTRRTDGPDKPLDSLREMSNRTWKYHVFFSCLLTQGDQHRLTNRIFFFFFFFFEYLCLATDDFFSRGGSKENLFYHGRADRYQASNRYFPFVRRPFEPPLLPRPVEIDIDDLNLRFSFGHASPLSLFSIPVCGGRQRDTRRL